MLSEVPDSRAARVVVRSVCAIPPNRPPTASPAKVAKQRVAASSPRQLRPHAERVVERGQDHGRLHGARRRQGLRGLQAVQRVVGEGQVGVAVGRAQAVAIGVVSEGDGVLDRRAVGLGQCDAGQAREIVVSVRGENGIAGELSIMSPELPGIKVSVIGSSSAAKHFWFFGLHEILKLPGALLISTQS